MIHVAERFAENAVVFEAFAALLNEPLVVVDASEQIIGCNRAALTAAGVASLEGLRSMAGGTFSPLFVPGKAYFTPDKAAWMGPLGEGNPTVALMSPERQPRPYRLRVQPLILQGERLFLIHLQDRESVRQAEQARHDFERFKQQFLSDISHEFRTPMNSILGFSGLLEQCVTDPLQHDYLRHIQQSAGTMFENIENLMELLQLENGMQRVEREPFKVYETFETFAQRFCPLAESQNIDLLFLIDPRLPESMIGDAGKIMKILRNLIVNALKFTAEGGQILVEIKVRELGRKTVVRYSVTDTGEGMDPQTLRALTQPPSDGDIQLQNLEGIGVGLTLAFRLLRLLGGEPGVSSTVGKGSRFSFTLAHPKVADTPMLRNRMQRVGVWSQKGADDLQLKILKNYLKLFEIETVELQQLVDAQLQDLPALFVMAAAPVPEALAVFKKTFPKLQTIPVVREKELRQIAEQLPSCPILTYPILPMKLGTVLGIAAAQAAGPVPVAGHVNAQERSAGHRILVAEDNPINQKLMTMVLNQHGYEVTAVSNGQEAVECYARFAFDAVLMDIDMPVMDGITATQAIKEIDRDERRHFVPVIALTVQTLAGDRERILGAGLDVHIGKPMDREYLLAVLEHYLKMKDGRNRKWRPVV